MMERLDHRKLYRLPLDEGLLRTLKSAGLFGLTFHIDSNQRRPKWKGKTNTAKNSLRRRVGAVSGS